ncbi:MAG: ABC transporter ATP-binding protein [Elusimicrobia bacterium]|nr:ABC transporter ATP-binding protein [Elusimicrobiota bacterium]
MIEIKNLVKKFDSFTAVNNLNLTVDSGEIFGFLGPNGAGKTTTVKMIAGIMFPTLGEIIVDGINVSKNPYEAKKKIAYIPDEPFVYPNLTAREFLRLIADIYEIDRKQADKSIEEYLSKFELLDRADKLLGSFSHGMKQKVMVAGVLMRNPKVILFDEPTVGLDPKSVKNFKEMIVSQTKKGVSVFMCTHILEMAEKICGRVGIIYEGKMVSCGPVEEILRVKNKNSLEDAFLEFTK